LTIASFVVIGEPHEHGSHVLLTRLCSLAIVWHLAGWRGADRPYGQLADGGDDMGATKTSPNSPKDAREEMKNEGAYAKPQVRTLSQRDVLSAVHKGSNFPMRGFAG
jgi:hypothetical protein